MCCHINLPIRLSSRLSLSARRVSMRSFFPQDIGFSDCFLFQSSTIHLRKTYGEDEHNDIGKSTSRAVASYVSNEKMTTKPIFT